MLNTFKNMWINIKREKFLAISNIMVMSFTFLLLGVFVYVVVISQTALRYLEDQVQLSVFFKDDFTEQSIMGLKSSLESDKRISTVKYVSKEDAFKIFTEINKNEPVLLESITPSILPASLEVKVHNLADLSPIADQLASTDGVEEVRFFKDVVQKFKFWSTMAYVIGFILVSIMIMVSYSVVLSTLRTTIHSKGTELSILKLVGATDAFVKKPLISQGIFFGTVSGVISGFILLLVGYGLNVTKSFASGFTFGFIPNLYINPVLFSLLLFILLIISGAALGYFGSKSAIKKYLNY